MSAFVKQIACDRVRALQAPKPSLALSLFEDICLKEAMSLADSLYNLQLVQEFCREHLARCCHLSLEDMLYAATSIKVCGPQRVGGGREPAEPLSRQPEACERRGFPHLVPRPQ